MIKERLSGLGMPLIHSGTDYMPKPEVIYQIKHDKTVGSERTRLRFT